MNLVKILVLEDAHYVIRRLKNKGINIFNIEYQNDGTVYTILESDLENIPFEVTVISYKGIKGIFSKMLLNKHFILSVILSIVIMYVLSSMIFDIEVIHSDKKLREMILEELTLNDIHPFMLKKSFKEKEEIKKKIKEAHKGEIEWLEIIDDGMKYTIRVEERIINKKTYEKKYCDVISTKDAIVLDGTVIKGQLVTTTNDYVKKDSVLIRGSILFNEKNKNYVCAEGTVYGNTWYTINISIPYEYEVKDYTGSTHKNISYEIGSKRVPIFKTHMEKYDTERAKLFTLGNLTIYRELDREYKSTIKKYTDEEIKNKALESARNKILTNLNVNSTILYEKVLQTHEFDSIIEMEIFYSVKEPISTQIEREIPEIIEGE